MGIHHEVVKANPGLSEKDLSAVKRAVMLTKAHAWKGRLDVQSKSKEAVSSVPLVKDSPLPFLNSGAIKPVDDRALEALQEGQSQEARRPYSYLTLTEEERMAVLTKTQIANPGANGVDFGMAYKIALIKADSQKRGIKPSGIADAVDLSLSPLSDSKDGREEESDASKDKRQVSSPTSPKENAYLAGFMKSPAKPQADIKAKRGKDKDFLSLIAPTTQVESVVVDAKGIQRAGDVSGHGGSMSAQHGSVSPIAFHDQHLADRQSAADVIRNGSSLSLLHSVEANGNNSTASLQVDASKLDENLGVGPASPTTQALQEYHNKAAKDLQERKEAAEERRKNKNKEKLPAPSSSDVEGQRVLTEAFCINRLDSIRQMVGSTKLGIFADGKDHSARAEQIAQFFGEFMRQNAEDDSPYFCVSAPI